MSDKEKKQPLYIKLDRKLYDLLQQLRDERNVTQISLIEHALRETYASTAPEQLPQAAD